MSRLEELCEKWWDYFIDIIRRVLGYSGLRIKEPAAASFSPPREEPEDKPYHFNPLEVLEVTTGASPGDIRAAFKVRITQAKSRELRVLVSLAYYALTTTERTKCFSRSDDRRKYTIVNANDPFLVVGVLGATAVLPSKIPRDGDFLGELERNEHGHTVLYLAARNGFCDTTEALLALGALVNEKQCTGSTALHGASFFGHPDVVELLLQYGVDPAITNQWGNTAEEEAASDEIREIIRKSKDDKFTALARSLISKRLAHRIRLIKDMAGRVVGKEIIRNEERLDSRTRKKWNTIQSGWETVWHGTRYEHLESIFQCGLVPSGTKLSDGTMIKPPSNHYPPGKRYLDMDNWANAMFVSPSIFYASDRCYSDEVESESMQWRVVMKARVKPSAYKEYNSTVHSHNPIAGEPQYPEFRVETCSSNSSGNEELCSSITSSAVSTPTSSAVSTPMPSAVSIPTSLIMSAPIFRVASPEPMATCSNGSGGSFRLKSEYSRKVVVTSVIFASLEYLQSCKMFRDQSVFT